MDLVQADSSCRTTGVTGSDLSIEDAHLHIPNHRTIALIEGGTRFVIPDIRTLFDVKQHSFRQQIFSPLSYSSH